MKSDGNWTPSPIPVPDPDLDEITKWHAELSKSAISGEKPWSEHYEARRTDGIWEKVDLADAILRHSRGWSVRLVVEWR